MKYVTQIIISLLIVATPVSALTLWEYYRGNLPTIEERGEIYSRIANDKYVGSLEQNIALAEYLEGDSSPILGAFGDPFISIQLADSPQADYILSTDGTDNTWIENTGGGGSDFAWTPTSYGVSTTTELGFLGGFLSTASSTIVTDGTAPALRIESQQTTSQSFAALDIINDSSSGIGLKITNTNSSNSQGQLRIDGGSPEIEMIETDQSSPVSKFEFRVQDRFWTVNSRNQADDSFEKLLGIQGMVNGGAMWLAYPDFAGGSEHPTVDARFNIVGKLASTTSNYLSISSNTSDGSGEGTTNDDILLVDGSGRLGIGNSAPSNLLTVNGVASALNFVATSTTATSTFAGGLTVDSTDLVVDPDGGRVGIGTASPQFKIDTGDSTDQVRFGAAELGYWAASADFAFFGHEALDQSAAGNYALLQDNSGRTLLNAASGQSLNFRINNSSFGVRVGS